LRKAYLGPFYGSPSDGKVVNWLQLFGRVVGL